MQRRLRLAAVGLAGSLLVAISGPGQAQDAAPAAAPAAPAAKAAAGTQPAATAVKPKAAAGDADLRKRVEQLEEQLVDLQVVIGTLESLARSGGGGASPAPRAMAPAGLSSADAARIEGLEMQVKALTSQLEQMSAQGRGGGPDAGAATAPATTSRFGSTTVNSANGDPIGGLIDEGAQGAVPGSPLPPVTSRVSPASPGAPAAVPAPAPGAVAGIDPAQAGGDPKQDYERAYGYLLQQDYGAAQAGFTDFLKVHPKDSLVPNALYWLGETHYVQRNYADAAEAFDLVMQGFGNSPKAPDSMLKRGMSLAALGKKPEACGLLGQIAGKYPSAPAHIKSKADSERQRIGCS